MKNVCNVFAGDHVQQGGGGARLQGAKPHHRRQEGQREPGDPGGQAQGQPDRYLTLPYLTGSTSIPGHTYF